MTEEVRSSLSVITAYIKTPECPEIFKATFSPKYGITIKTRTEFETVHSLISFYCMAKLIDGSSVKLLRKQLITLLTIYFIAGINDNKARNEAMKILKIKRASLNSLNGDLRALGFTVRNNMRTGLDRLNEELEELRGYYLNNKKNPALLLSLKQGIVVEDVETGNSGDE